MFNDYVSTLERDSLAFVDSLDRDPVVGSVIRGDASRATYVAFLRATYHYIRWSGPLLAQTAEGLRASRRAPWLLELVDSKTREESPHDGWVLDDLERCGDNRELLKAALPPIAVTAYVTWSRSIAEAGSPGYLGAAYTLEFISAHRARLAADNLRAHGGVPGIGRALSFLEGHGDADLGHLAHLNTVLARIEDAQDRADIALSAAVMRALYLRFFAGPPSPSPAVSSSIDLQVA